MSINPAFLTFKEYLDVINPDGKRHPSQSYQLSLDRMNRYTKTEDFPEVLNHFTSNGRKFELRQKTERVWDRSYIKKDSNGEHLRNANGELVYHTPEELKALGKKEFEYEHAIIDRQTGKIVGKTENEWECLLVMVAEEYQGMGLGPILSYENRKRQPDRQSGGMTARGEASCFKAYQRMVAESLTQGKYREALMSGDLSFNSIARILESAYVVGKYVNKKKEGFTHKGYPDIADSIKKFDWGRSAASQFDLNVTKPEDVRLYVDGSTAILYSTKLLSFMKDENSHYQEKHRYFHEEGVLGYAYVGGVYDNTSTPKLFRLYGKNDKTRSFMAEVMLNLNLGEPVRVLNSDIPLLRDKVLNHADLRELERQPSADITLHHPTLSNLDALIELEKADRKEKDNPYGENWIRIHEMAYALAEESYEASIERDDVSLSA